MSIRDRSVLTDSGIALESMYRSAFLPLQKDCYRENYMWPAKVVSPAQPASSKDLYALQNAGENLEEGVSPATPKISFRAYILNQGSPQKCQSPHAFFQDPCLLRDNPEPACVNQLIQDCILVTSPESYAGPIPQVGDTVTIMLHQSDQHGAYDLQFAELISVANSSIREATNFDTQVACQNLQEFFDEGEYNTSDPPAPQGTPSTPTPQAAAVPGAIAAKAQNYDSSTDLPNKSQHAPMFLSEMHPEFVVYAKAVLFDLWNQKQISVRLNSTYRTVAKQRKYWDKHQAWIAGGRVGPQPYAAAPARPGYSKHNLGTAIDFNPTVEGIVLGSRKLGTTKQQWLDSGIPEIIAANGLVWGGNWNNYDPIHMHLEVSETVRAAIINASGDIESKTAAVSAIAAVSLA